MQTFKQKVCKNESQFSSSLHNEDGFFLLFSVSESDIYT